jgi:hypothetical protein
MLKKIVFGSGDGFITDYETKIKIIDWLYDTIDLSKHRYNILNNTIKLKFLQENPHYVSPNFKGFNYLLIMLTIDNKKYCVAIDRRKLSYHKSQLDMKTIMVTQINMNVDNINIYKGTVFDGKLIIDMNNNRSVFLIQDCFHLMGKKLLDMEMQDKMIHLDNIITMHFKKMESNRYCKNFEFKLNKLYTYDDLEKLINSLATLSIPNNGLIFYPKTSGITVLYTEKKVEKVTINSNNEIIEQKSYHIIKNFIEFLKSRTYSYEENSKMKSFWLSRTNIPDVYDISEKEYGEKEGIAMIPNLKTSQMCDETIGDDPVRFNCIYNTKFKKWIPLNSL